MFTPQPEFLVVIIWNVYFFITATMIAVVAVTQAYDQNFIQIHQKVFCDMFKTFQFSVFCNRGKTVTCIFCCEIVLGIKEFPVNC